MKALLKIILKTVLPGFLVRLIRKFRNAVVIYLWKKKGRPLPPPKYLKHQIISNYQHQNGYTILVETGTYLGEMIEAQLNNFKKIISVELDDNLYNKAKIKFRKSPHVKLFHGDSGKLMSEMIKEVDQPAIFWLDGHYCGGISALGASQCPIFGELDSIIKSQYKHILLIDDARCFNGTNDYPTIEQVKLYFENKGIKHSFNVADDIIRIEIL